MISYNRIIKVPANHHCDEGPNVSLWEKGVIDRFERLPSSSNPLLRSIKRGWVSEWPFAYSKLESSSSSTNMMVTVTINNTRPSKRNLWQATELPAHHLQAIILFSVGWVFRSRECGDLNPSEESIHYLNSKFYHMSTSRNAGYDFVLYSFGYMHN